MVPKTIREHTLQLDKIVGGGQALGVLDDGRKAFVWGGLPGETVTIRETKRKTNFIEGTVAQIHEASPQRITPLDPDSYLSTSPWQIMTFDAEQHYKAALILEAFELHNVQLPGSIDVYSDDVTAHYRNKVEFSWFSERREDELPERHLQPESVLMDAQDGPGVKPSEGSLSSDAVQVETLDLAFFRRGSKGKIKVDGMSLLPEPMMRLAREIRDDLRSKNVTARQLKTLLIRCDQRGNCAWQLYIKDEACDFMPEKDAAKFQAQGGEVIYSDPRSPASRITKRLLSVGNPVLTDTILDVPFRYATEGFFQVNIPVYEQALTDMRTWVTDSKVIDLYSGVGSIGLTIGGEDCALIEIDENAVREMKQNISELKSNAKAILAPAEKALEYINSHATIIVDPPRAGLHADVVARLLETTPPRIIYLSCNPVTQARDVALLAEKYKITHHQGYNFFPRTPHIEHLVILDRF